MLKVFALVLSLFSSTPAGDRITPESNNPPAAINLTAIHSIFCTDNGMVWQGTGFLIKEDVIATANHVQGKKCFDATAGKVIKTYKTDKRHDFALMTGDVPIVGPYIHYSCARPIPGQDYLSYGQSSMGMPSFFSPILRNNPIRATKGIDNIKDAVPGFIDSRGMRVYSGAIASGMSGGPVANIYGTVLAVNNAGNSKETLLFDLADTGLCTGKWD